MNFLTPPFIGRRLHSLLLGGLVLFLSCQSDPIVFNPPGGYEYKTKSFPLNNETSGTVQGELHTGTSPRLYSGILSNGDTVSTLIRLSPEVLDSHQVCGSDNIIKVDILITSIIPISVKEDTIINDTLFQFNTLKTYLISSDDFGEDVVISEDILNSIRGLTINVTPLNVELNTNSLELNLLEYDSTIIKKWCEDKEELGIVISYVPTDSSYLEFLEFYSSNSSEVGLGPRLSLEYTVEEETSRNYNHYSINDADWSGGLFNEDANGPYYIEKTLSENWDMIYFYAFNLKENSPSPSPEMQSYDSLLFQDEIIASENLNKVISLLKINVTLNSDIEEIDSISFSILNAFAFISDDDPAGDNWNVDTNPDSTENNLVYDEGELFNDYGVDNCPDELETGDENNPCDSTLSIYNSTGTEGNGQLDWTDENDNGVWDVDEGEEWFDWGSDWCPDSLESGEGFCIAELAPCHCLDVSGDDLGYDPNNDNADPAGDDWHEINNPDSTEGNHNWDPGEPFYDWGLDGLPEDLVGYSDEFEGNDTLNWTDKNNNGIWEQGEGEQWFDTGTDGKFNEEEVEDYNKWTEGNFKFDLGERFLDCGEDNICNDTEGDDDTDNYNIDPNADNWSANDSTSTGTEGNGVLDWTDENGDDQWNFGEGEEWFDWGLDGIQDSLEAFQALSDIPIEQYDINYIFDLSMGELLSAPDLITDTVSLWLSKIERIDNSNSMEIEVSVQSNVALKGLQFQLSHIPFTKVDTTLETYTPSIAQLGENKLFEDFTLLPKRNYSDEELDEQLLIEYSNDLSTFLDFDSLNLFLENEEYIFSHQYSKLVFYIDTTTTDIHEDGMRVYIAHTGDSGEDEILSNLYEVTSLSDSVEIAIGHILRDYQSGSITSYNGLKLKTDGNLYNYSKLSIKNNLRIDVMYSQ